MRPLAPLVLAVTVTSAVLGLAARADAQGQQILEVEAPAENNGFMVVQEQFEINQATFDQWIYGNRLRNSTAPEYLESLLNVRLAEVGRSCNLADAQLDRLRLAGHGDIKRFGDRVAEVRADFDRLKRDQARMNDLFQQAQPLAAQLNAGLFGDRSFFSKAIGSTLSAEQKAAQAAATAAKEVYRFRARVLLAVATLDASIGLTSDQQRRYVAAIMDASTPPKGLGGPLDANIVLLKIAQVPEGAVRPIFDADQWAQLQQLLAPARAMEPFLRANGHLDGKAAPGNGAAAVAVPGEVKFQIQELRINRDVAK